MLILTPENVTYDLNNIPEENDDIRYCVFDTNEVDHKDYYFPPLVFLESFQAPAVVLEIGPYRMQMPLDWSIVVCDEDMTDIEILPLTSLNGRGFFTMVYNPLKHMVPEIYEINIVNVYAEVKWFFPKIKSGRLLVVPLTQGYSPDCALFIKDKTRLTDMLQIGELFE